MSGTPDMPQLPPVDTLELFELLAATMNAHPEVYEPLGWCDIDLAIVMERPSAEPFRVLIRLRDYGCEEVRPLEPGDEARADCWLDGGVDLWQDMFADVVASGRATGDLTLSSVVLLGDRLRVRGEDAARIDRFFRFAETIQRFINGAATVAAPATV